MFGFALWTRGATVDNRPRPPGIKPIYVSRSRLLARLQAKALLAAWRYARNRSPSTAFH
jgi:hypothetical protein